MSAVHPIEVHRTRSVRPTSASGTAYGCLRSQRATADNPERYSIPYAWTFLLLGWLVGRSTTARLRLLTAAVATLATVGFFGDHLREGVVIGAVLLLLLAPQVRVPARLLGILGVLAASSLWVYLLHWEVYPPVEEVSEPLALLVSFGVGVPAWWAWTRTGRAFSGRRHQVVGGQSQ